LALYRPEGSNSNRLIGLNFDQILDEIRDANTDLLSQVTEALEASQKKLEEEINSKFGAENLRNFLEQIKKLQKELQTARLNDGRPFTDAAKKIKTFFEEYENKLKSLDRSLTNKLSSYMLSLEEKEKAVDQGNPQIEDGSEDLEYKEEASNQPIELPGITLQWFVESFDVNELDLESLRNYFTDAAIRNALKSHLQMHGPNLLRGVKYTRQVSQPLIKKI